MDSRKQFEEWWKEQRFYGDTMLEKQAFEAWQAGRASMLAESTQALQNRYMGDNNREDAEVKRCIEAVKAIQP